MKKELPRWVAPSVRDALESPDPAATVKRLVDGYRAARRYVDARIAEDQAAAFGVDVRNAR